jgi:serine/threonine-protein kinase HipA
MPEPVKLVKVFFGGEIVGQLAMIPDRRCVFEYDAGWLERGFSISPFYLPLKSGLATARHEPFDGLFGVFYDSLPDGWGKLLMDRWLRKQGRDPGSLSQLDRLSLVGRHGMGALAYLPDHGLATDNGEQQPLDFYAGEVQKVLANEDTGALDVLLRTAGSSAGVRPKVMVTLEGKEWLVKFRAMNDPEGIGDVEYRFSLLAREAGIDMPETRLFQGRYFGTRRFDLDGTGRLHVHSAAGLLYASYRYPSLDYIGLMKAVLALTRDMNEAEKMFRLMVFNVVTGNRDDHARNFSFIYKDGSWKVSPAYDLLPSEGFGGQHTTTVNGKGHPALSDCLEVARQTGFPEARARKVVDQVLDAVPENDRAVRT